MQNSPIYRRIGAAGLSPYQTDPKKIRNRLLIALPSQVREQVLRQCQYVEFPSGQTIYAVGAPIEQAYFINSGLVSLIKTMDDGRCTEIGAVGVEGLVGVFAANGLDRPLVDYTVQVPVAALRMNLMALRNEMPHNAKLSRLIEAALFLHVYPVHVMTRKSFGLMMRKLSVTESQRSAQFPGTFSRRNLSVASANWAQVA